MSRKRKAPVRKIYPDPKFHSEVVSKFINSIMYDGLRVIGVFLIFFLNPIPTLFLLKLILDINISFKIKGDNPITLVLY